jgi:hypothetical protein
MGRIRGIMPKWIWTRMGWMVRPFTAQIWPEEHVPQVFAVNQVYDFASKKLFKHSVSQISLVLDGHALLWESIVKGYSSTARGEIRTWESMKSMMSMMSMKHFHTFSTDRSQLQAWICHASHAAYPQQERARSWAPDEGSQFERFSNYRFFSGSPDDVHPCAVKMRKTSQFVCTDWLMMFLWEYMFNHQAVYCTHKYLMSAQDWKIEKQQHAGSCFSGTISKNFHASFVTSWSLWRGKPQIKRGIFIPPSQFRTLLRFLTALGDIRHRDATLPSPSWHGWEWVML